MNTQLLCTFSNIRNYTDEIKAITNFYEVVFGKVYVLQDVDNVDDLLLTYNINQDNLISSSFYANTISVHRKKGSNTIYTINSLNKLIEKLNNGKIDSNFPINWNDYQNCALLTDSTNGFRILSTKLYQIVKI
tara:strand:+ start:1259 stop:1657 length:399 start_codon:yes stop_codon:yes gene_type:complete